MALEKARLEPHSWIGSKPDEIIFMFNPSELEFTRQVAWHSDRGNRSSTLLPKVNFSGVDPYTCTLQNLLFDTYETGKSVLTEHISKLKQGVTAEASSFSRPPVYRLMWGNQDHFYCVMTSLTYQLTLFLEDGTPVKAIVNIGIQEVDKTNLPGGRGST
ncbi:MAG: hypothetical protein WA902_22075, partial [Thermosynechococcaceae cyanobacterium]